MRLLGWRRRRNIGDDEFPQGLAAASPWDEQLSAYLDSELDDREAVAVEDALGADPALATQLDELRVVREALGSLGELRAPRPFTLEAPPTAVRHTPGRLELIFRMGAVAAAVAFAVVLTGDFVGLGNEGVEGWGISRPWSGGGSSEQASDAPQAAQARSFAAPEAATAASTPQTAPTPVATVAQAAATVAATPAPTATSAPTAVAAAAATAEPTAADASSAPTTDSRTAGRALESSETAEAPSANEAPAPTAAGQGSEAAPAAKDTTAADGAAAEDDGTDAAEAAPPAAATAAAAAATPEPAAMATAPATGNQTMMGEAEGGDDGARALRTAEQWLLLAAVALAVLALGLGLRRRGSRA